MEERDQYTIVLEDIYSRMGLLVEGQQELKERIDSIDDKTDRFDSEMRKGFQMTFEHINRMEDKVIGELRKKADVKKMMEMEKRLSRFERASFKAR